MRTLISLVMISAIATLGCGGAHEDNDHDIDAAAAHQGMPEDDVHGTMSDMPDDDVHAGAMGGGMHTGRGINAEVTLDPEIADDWKSIRVRVVELESMDETIHEIAIGEEAALGESGLTLRAVAFIPDFVMSEGGITTRSADPQNPAARVVIIEQGKDDYEGWLFGAMPEIHAYPHEKYGVMLAEGVPLG